MPEMHRILSRLMCILQKLLLPLLGLLLDQMPHWLASQQVVAHLCAGFDQISQSCCWFTVHFIDACDFWALRARCSTGKFCSNHLHLSEYDTSVFQTSFLENKNFLSKFMQAQLKVDVLIVFTEFDDSEALRSINKEQKKAINNRRAY